MCVQ
jgi:hypothetical protein